MALAIWSPFMVGRAARQCLYNFLAFLASSRRGTEELGTNAQGSGLEGKAVHLLNTAVQLLSRNATLEGGRCRINPARDRNARRY